MLITRRQMLKGSAGLALLGWSSSARAAEGEAPGQYTLDIRPGQAELLDAGGPKTPIWGYDGIVPGPLLRVKRGQRMTVAVTNKLVQPTSVHWHGLRIENAMDGVAGLTQEPIQPGETFNYSFVPPDAGTHWYHSHNRGWEQVARGLYGPLIVDEDDAVDVDRDLIIMADDWRLKSDGMLHEESFGNIGDRAHGGRLGNVLTLNAKPYERLIVKSGERVRLRMINSANARIMQFRLAGVEPWLAALDGQAIEPLKLAESALRLAPAQRADLIFDVAAAAGAELAISEVSGEEPLVAGYLQVEEAGDTPKRSADEAPALPKHNVPMPDYSKARIVELDMAGGAMGSAEDAVYKGKTLDARTLAREHGQVWTMNGTAGTGLEPLFSAAQGETIVIRIKNDTRWPHGMHMHGHHFVEKSRKPTAGFDF
ncbi:MAG: multicopper oxidase domain-containing protein, partial [Hyphomicrobiales bacterium]|nr:multicopper oxidase domain-containing protein [Hyphomicrobiales bacterium]